LPAYNQLATSVRITVNMVSQKTIDIVKATAPVVKEKGKEITDRMYEIAFGERPEYKRFFENTWMKDPAEGKNNPQS